MLSTANVPDQGLSNLMSLVDTYAYSQLMNANAFNQEESLYTMQDLEDFDMDEDDLQEDYAVEFNGSVDIPDALYKKTLDKMGYEVPEEKSEMPKAPTYWGNSYKPHTPFEFKSRSGPVRSSRPVRAGSLQRSDTGLTNPPTDGGYTPTPVKQVPTNPQPGFIYQIVDPSNVYWQLNMRFDRNPTHMYPFAYMTESDPSLGNRVMWQFHNSMNKSSGNIIIESLRHKRMTLPSSAPAGYQLIMHDDGLLGNSSPSQTDKMREWKLKPTGNAPINGLATQRIWNEGKQCYLYRDGYSVKCARKTSYGPEFFWGFRDPFEVSQAWQPIGLYAGKNVDVTWNEVRTLIDKAKNTYTSTYKGSISAAAKIQLGKLLWPEVGDNLSLGINGDASAAYSNAWEHTWENNKQRTITMEMKKPQGGKAMQMVEQFVYLTGIDGKTQAIPTGNIDFKEV